MNVFQEFWFARSTLSHVGIRARSSAPFANGPCAGSTLVAFARSLMMRRSTGIEVLAHLRRPLLPCPVQEVQALLSLLLFPLYLPPFLLLSGSLLGLFLLLRDVLLLFPLYTRSGGVHTLHILLLGVHHQGTCCHTLREFGESLVLLLFLLHLFPFLPLGRPVLLFPFPALVLFPFLWLPFLMHVRARKSKGRPLPPAMS